MQVLKSESYKLKIPGADLQKANRIGGDVTWFGLWKRSSARVNHCQLEKQNFEGSSRPETSMVCFSPMALYIYVQINEAVSKGQRTFESFFGAMNYYNFSRYVLP